MSDLTITSHTDPAALLETIRTVNPVLAQALMLDALDMPSGQFCDANMIELSRYGIGWDLALNLYGYLAPAEHQ